MPGIDYPQLAGMVFDMPLLIQQSKLEQILGVLKPRFDGTHPLQATAMAKEDESRVPAYRMVGSIAVVPVIGTLIHRHSFVSAMSGMSAYGDIEARLAAALDDSKVEGVMLEIDSHGGMVAGCFDLARSIAAQRGRKPIWAMVNESAYSAGYAIASAADKVIVPQTGGVGSVGVIMAHVDESEADKKDGMKWTYIYAGAHKKDFNSHEPLSDAAAARLQESIDETYEAFVSLVAEHRGMSVQAVRDTEALTYSAKKAVEVGFADVVMPVNEAIAALEQEIAGGGSPVRFIRPTQTERKVAMNPETSTDENENEAAPAASQENPEAVEGTLIMGSDFIHEAAAEKDKLLAIGAERERAAAIVKQAAALGVATEPLVQNLIADGVSLAEASGQLIDRKAQLSDTQHIQAAHSGQDQSGEANLPLEDRCQAEWDRNAALRAEFGGKFSRYLAFSKREEKAVA